MSDKKNEIGSPPNYEELSEEIQGMIDRLVEMETKYPMILDIADFKRDSLAARKALRFIINDIKFHLK